MKIASYAICAIIVNFILYNSFAWGLYGSALEVIVVAPVIFIAVLACTLIHIALDKAAIKTRYFQAGSLLFITLLSYYTFLGQETPFGTIKKMVAQARHYSSVSYDDYLLDGYYDNYLKIVAAKKKFAEQIPPAIYIVTVENVTGYNNYKKQYSIYFKGGQPTSTNKALIIQKAVKDTFRFQQSIGNDTIVFYGCSTYMKKPVNIADTVTNGIYPENSTVKRASIDVRFKNETPDERYWAYKIFYWLL